MKKTFLLVSLLFTIPAFFLFAEGSQEAESEPGQNTDITVEIRHCDS